MAGARNRIDWRFLTRWRAVLCPLLAYVDCEELDAGTMHDRLDHLRVHMEDLNSNIQHAKNRRRNETKVQHEYFTRVREALELIGLALHYDPLAWSGFLHPPEWSPYRIHEPFSFDASQLQPFFEIVLMNECYPYARGFQPHDYANIHEIFVEIDDPRMSNAYRHAKSLIKELVGSRRFENDAYRIPLRLSLVPEWEWHDERTFAETTRSLLWSLSASDSCFQLVSMDLYLWHAPLTAWLTDLMREIRLANVVLTNLGLPQKAPSCVDRGIAINIATGVTRTNQQQLQNGKLVETLGSRENTSQGIMALYSSIAYACQLQCLNVNTGLEELSTRQRGLYWRWLGFALAGQYSNSSVRYLWLEQPSLTVQDVENCIGANRTDAMVANEGLCPPDPQSAKNQVQRSIFLDSTSKLRFKDGTRHTLSDLQLTSQDGFLLLDTDSNCADSEPMVTILVPGFGVCTAHCESIIDAQVIQTHDPPVPQIDTLWLELTTCEPLALGMLAPAIGTNLLRLRLHVETSLTLTTTEAAAILKASPLLEFLDLGIISFATMDVFADAYETGDCRISVVALWNSLVDPASLTRFVRRMHDPQARVSSRLREFRYIYQARDRETSQCPKIIDEDCASAFETLVERPSRLTALEIGLVGEIFVKYVDRITRHDRGHASKFWLATKLAFISVLVRSSTAEPLVTKKAKGSGKAWLPVKFRRRLVSHILAFIRPPTTRIVRVVRVPR